MIQIIEVKTFEAAHISAIQRLLDQLTTRSIPWTEETHRQFLSEPTSHLFLLQVDQAIAGMLTVGCYASPTGGKAWIEDVVVDNAFRGQGLSKRLMHHAIEWVRQAGISQLMLTSKPVRVAANHLYQSLQFERKETNVYLMKL